MSCIPPARRAIVPPPIASYDYDGVVASYNRQYMAPELHEEMTEKLQIAHIEPILRKHGEYIVYGTMIENGVNREKKMRFSYYDRGKEHMVNDSN